MTLLGYFAIFLVGLVEGSFVTDWWHKHQVIKYVLGKPKNLQKKIDELEKGFGIPNVKKHK